MCKLHHVHQIKKCKSHYVHQLELMLIMRFAHDAI